ncbi:sugar ABC transporter permease [Cryobacterium sp. TMS1-20-1]|uniref:carbohydrate ABC transporter permease n=1 Tax=Cryobacterium sp. TMS1-20-1 TaxID=1259223 RepID=UPI00106CA2C6|nr:sugar ABC transporter permease [Cryobacterium sp. TMS1-20-1]TFC77267.1 sugar ABC transporter permease [Cryobacterium sp. TMS1-20-1]
MSELTTRSAISPPRARRRFKGTVGRAGRRKVVLPFLLPALLVYSVVFVYPAVQALWISLHEWNGFQQDMVYIGLGNFTRMVGDATFWSALQNTLLITVVGGASIFVLVFFFSASLQRKIPGKKFFRAVIFFPVILPGVGVGLIWQFIFNNSWGPLSEGLKAIGLGFLDRAWLAPENIVSSLTVAIVWTFVGYYLIIVLAGIAKIPITYFEAARIDGASEWRIFRSVTIPMVWDVLIVAVTLWVISALKIFDLIIATTYPSPPRGSFTLTVFVWERAVGMYTPVFQLGYATALGVVLLILVVVSVAVIRTVSRRDALEY